MRRVYRVEYEEKWTGCREWIPAEKINVLANGNAMKAIAKVRKNSLGKSYVTEDTGKVEKCIGFRFIAVSIVAEAQI